MNATKAQHLHVHRMRISEPASKSSQSSRLHVAARCGTESLIKLHGQLIKLSISHHQPCFLRPHLFPKCVLEVIVDFLGPVVYVCDDIPLVLDRGLEQEGTLEVVGIAIEDVGAL